MSTFVPGLSGTAIAAWMGAFTTKDRLSELKFRLDFLQTLEVLPVSNKTTLHDSKVYQENDITVPACTSMPIKSVSIANEENVQLPEVKSAENELKQLVDDVLQCCRKLMANWEQLPESFRIPKKQRLEQMKEHEREADQGCKQTVEEVTPHNAAFSTRFNERFGEREKERPIEVADSSSREKDPRQRSSRYKTFDSNYQKMQRRQMFEARVSGDQRFRLIHCICSITFNNFCCSSLRKMPIAKE